MTRPAVAPFGAWKSSITSDLIVAGTIGLGQIALDGDDVYWIEARPSEAGRNVVVRRTADGHIADVTPPPFNVRTRVHEYGGGAYAVADGTVFFANFADQRLYRQDPGALPQPITPEGDRRYADFVVDRGRSRLIARHEAHSGGGQDAVNSLIAVAADGDAEARVLVSGHDFYAFPRLSPDASRLAWLAWNHPNMPWDGCQLWVADVARDGSLAESVLVAGGDEESIFQPSWSPAGVLHFVSERSGWWNLYRQRDGEVEPLCELDAEFAAPQWVFGLSTYAFTSTDQIVCTYVKQGISQLALLSTATRQREPLATPYTVIDGVQASGTKPVFHAGSLTEPMAVVRLDLSTRRVETLRRASDTTLDPDYLSSPETITFPTEGEVTAHGFFYPPQNRDFVAPDGELPPLLVMSHGGPTSATTTALNLKIQYWTSRGIAVLDVNYGGSTGYGRAYRQRLDGQWGIVDVDDCVNGARFLAARGDVDGERLAITGGSAGGYTTLSALTFRDAFKAGASYYGIGDLEAMARDTHKFESRYLDRLIGPYPKRQDRYHERSPIHFTDRLAAPVIFFQGMEDEVVPPNQAEAMVAALRKKGLPVAYIPFEGEQHGFRRAENIKRALDAELFFYAQVFGFNLAESIAPVAIENLPIGWI